jgi:hypothetical protein
MADPCQFAKRFIFMGGRGTEEATFVTRLYGLTRETQQTSDRDCSTCFRHLKVYGPSLSAVQMES